MQRVKCYVELLIHYLIIFNNERETMRQLFIATILAFFIILQAEDVKALDYALTQAMLVEDNCMVFVLLRGEAGDEKIVYKSKKDGDLCSVNIKQEEFEKHFNYCVLSGIHVKQSGKLIAAAFGGGPASGRDNRYWFEWGDPTYIQPDFYCIRKSTNDPLKK